MSSSKSDSVYDLVVAGGGAAGFFAAITCAEASPDARIVILEKSREVLGKVKISGGGRCNVTHACFDPRELTEFYPRGSKQLMGPFHRWGPGDTMDWFEEHRVPLKVEDDNRVFPKSDQSQTVVDCLVRSAKRAGIEIRTSTGVDGATVGEDGVFRVTLEGSETILGKHLVVTLGGIRNAMGAEIASNMGHQIVPAAPSLFTFKIRDRRLEGLQGLSVVEAQVRVTSDLGGQPLETSGPVLITHWGLSGPAVLRLSAWGARVIQDADYRFEIAVNWCGQRSGEEVMNRFDQLRVDSPKRQILNDPQYGLAARLWKRLIEPVLEADPELRWPHLSRNTAEQLVTVLTEARFQVEGKSMNKDEFVTSGGVDLKEVQFKAMESRLVPRLYFAGEVLDIDGITGGFNFQAAWTTGRIAGEAIAASIESE